jgi:hypothetical protein
VWSRGESACLRGSRRGKLSFREELEVVVKKEKVFYC